MKYGLGHILGDFFSNSSGYPGLGISMGKCYQNAGRKRGLAFKTDLE
jgi:hypothetical protein